MKWIKASGRLGIFEDSDIPDWKFFNPRFCKLDNDPTERCFFRKDTTTNKIVFSYACPPGTDFNNELPEEQFYRIEWLDESEPTEPKGLQEIAEKESRIKQLESQLKECYAKLSAQGD